MERMECDVLVIGGGGAAERAAIAAHDAGARVLMAVKGRLGGGATGFGVSEMAGYNSPDGAADPSDSPEAYYNDIMEAAMGMADPEAARVVAENAADTVRQLEEWGVKYERTASGGFYAFKSCYSSKARTHVIKGHGEPVVKAMGRQIRRRNIAVREGVHAAALIVRDGAVAGAAAVDGEGNEILLSAKAVVMATGGATQAMEKNMNPPDVTGDGYAMAFRAGAKFVNMEFMQAGMGFVHPAVSLINAYIWGGHPILTNAEGTEFMRTLPGGLDWRDVMDEHRKHFPFSSRDQSRWLEVSIQKELAEGRGTEHGGVYADFTMMTDDYVRNLSDEYGVHRMWPIARDYFVSRGIKVLERKNEVACFAHAINGGIRVDAGAGSSLPGLYAAGETAGGPHGADRLGGNMMVTCQVFGRLAGENAAAFAAARQNHAADAASYRLAAEPAARTLRRKIDAGAIRRDLGAAAGRHLLVRRTAGGLRELLSRIDGWEKAIESAPATGPANPENLATANLLLSARLMAAAALRRGESRGSHFREDCADVNPDLGRPWVFDKAGQRE